MALEKCFPNILELQFENGRVTGDALAGMTIVVDWLNELHAAQKKNKSDVSQPEFKTHAGLLDIFSFDKSCI